MPLRNPPVVVCTLGLGTSRLELGRLVPRRNAPSSIGGTTALIHAEHEHGKHKPAHQSEHQYQHRHHHPAAPTQKTSQPLLNSVVHGLNDLGLERATFAEAFWCLRKLAKSLQHPIETFLAPEWGAVVQARDDFLATQTTTVPVNNATTQTPPPTPPPARTYAEAATQATATSTPGAKRCHWGRKGLRTASPPGLPSTITSSTFHGGTITQKARDLIIQHLLGRFRAHRIDGGRHYYHRL